MEEALRSKEPYKCYAIKNSTGQVFLPSILPGTHPTIASTIYDQASSAPNAGSEANGLFVDTTTSSATSDQVSSAPVKGLTRVKVDQKTKSFDF